jgi:hypothetical protein
VRQHHEPTLNRYKASWALISTTYAFRCNGVRPNTVGLRAICPPGQGRRRGPRRQRAFLAEGSQFLISDSFALVIRGAASGSGFGFVHFCARIVEDMCGHESTRIGWEARCWGAAAVWFPARGVSGAHRGERVAHGFADRSQFLLSSNDLLWLCGSSAAATIFRLCRTVHGSRKICAMHKAARPMPAREEMKGAQERECRRVPRRDRFRVFRCCRRIL